MSDSPLVSLDRVTADIVMTERGAAVGLRGVVHDPVRRLRAVRPTLVQRSVRLPATAVFLETRLLEPHQSGLVEPTYAAGLDGGFFLSAIFPTDADLEDGLASIEAHLTWTDGGESDLRLAFVKVQRVRPLLVPPASSAGVVGIAMATYRPDPARFVDQIASLRDQTLRDWVCVISDDASGPAPVAMMRDVLGDDRRFHLLANPNALGFYRNFERALAAVPEMCRTVAFCDQDDVWRRNRLDVGLAVLERGGSCVFSDLDVTRANRDVLSPTFWVHRRRDYGSLSGLLLANVATGMTMLFDRDLARSALPFPAVPNLAYHDHWIGLLAERRNGLRYAPERLVSYVQHTGNHTGALTPPQAPGAAVSADLRRLYELVSIPLRRSADPARVRGLLSDLAYWSCGEASRFRILARALEHRVGSASDAQSRRMAALCRGFGLLAALRAGIDWRDRYRTAIMIHVSLAMRTKSLILWYAAWNRRALERRAAAMPATPSFPPASVP